MKKRRLLSILLSMCMVVSLMPQMAFADSSATGLSAYATKLQLMEGTDAGTGKLNLGKNSEGKPQQWYILGRDNGAEGDNTIIFAAAPVLKGRIFEDDLEHNKSDSSLWRDCTYTGTAPSEVYPNHYGASDLRAALKSMTDSANTSYFTAAEKKLLNDTKVTTWDVKNNVTYEVTDRLYAPMADNFGDKAIKIGSGDGKVLVMDSYWGTADSPFWLRSPLVYEDVNSLALSATPNEKVNADMVNNPLAVRPASNLKLTDVLFASAAEAAADGPVCGTVSPGVAMTLRLDGSDRDIGTVTYNGIEDCIMAVKGTADGSVSLLVQGNDGTGDWYYSKPVRGTETVTLAEISSALGLSSDIYTSDCRIWLETADEDGMIYAVNMPDDEVEKLIKDQAIAAVKSIKSTVTLSTKNVKRGIKVSVKIPSSQKADKTGIIIYRSTKKNSGYAMYKKVKTSGATYTVTNTLNVKGSRLVKGKRYYYKARVYRVIDGRKYYGPMSGVKYMRAK